MHVNVRYELGSVMGRWRNAEDVRRLRTDDWLFDALETDVGPPELVRLVASGSRYEGATHSEEWIRPFAVLVTSERLMIARKKGLARTPQIVAWSLTRTRAHHVRAWRGHGPGWELTFDVGGPLRIVLVFSTVEEAEAVTRHVVEPPRAPEPDATPPTLSRVTALAEHCLNRIGGMPVADTSLFGRPIADIYGLDAPAELVRAVLRQDLSLSAHVAVRCMTLLDQALATGPQDWDENIGSALASVGIGQAGRLTPDMANRLATNVRERCEQLGRFAMSIFWAVARPEIDDPDRDLELISRMFAMDLPHMRETAHDIAAWACVIIARLHGRGIVRMPDSPSEVPAITEPDWYVDPVRPASRERYWDGDWTDRVRRLQAGGWHDGTLPLTRLPKPLR